MIKVVVVGRDELFRAGMCSVLEASRRIEVMARTGLVGQLPGLVVQHRPDVVVVDVPLNGPAEVDALQSAHRVHAELKVVVLMEVGAAEFPHLPLHAGAAGLLDRSVSPQELVNVVVTVGSGESMVISPAIAHRIIDRFLSFDPGRAVLAQDRIGALTTREREVLAYVAMGYGNAEIAHRIYVSEGAVKAHVSHLLTKLGCANRVQAAIVACDSGMYLAHPMPIEAAS